ncbi:MULTISPECIES: restriction endonuclease subunit S [Enterobacteriaceae]|uniref:restriction endonuclease subunit S n=1 Tax=Enterobacteriaceae TaxID=543 RepID=UPI001F3530EF|nr:MULTISPECIES: restriction endonuclease subunit S [Enterobacteriaceae]MEC5725809.1 restriction endonuclease subunit S [Citrobacter amalonaticus]
MSTGKFPEGWVSPQLDEIATDINYGYTASSTSENIGPKMLRITDIQDNKVDWNSVPFCKIEDNQKDKYLLCNGDLVFARTGATVGKSFLINEDISNTVFASYLIRVRCNKKISSHYLSYFFRSPTYWSQITEFSAGIGQPNVNGSKLKKLNLPLASVYEQKIIAEKLDTLLAQVDSTKARLEQIPQILKRFRQAVLAAAVNGKLADRLDGNRHWQEQQLSHVASHIVDCPHSTPKWSSEGKYCVRTTAFSPFYLDLSYQGYVDEETYQNRIQRLKPEPDDILYSREGTIGIACQIPKGVELCLGQRMVLIRASDKISSKYLTIVLNSNNILKIVRSKTMGSTAPRINMSDIKSYPIPLPPLQEQHEIVRRVELLFAYADTIEKQVNSALTRVNSLTQSILAKAFRGELTAQWRAENPDLISGENSAAALLEKIKAERAASGGKKTSRKKA